MNPPPLTVIESKISIESPHRVYFTKDLWKVENPLLANLLRDSERSPRAILFVDSGFLSHHPTIPDQSVRYCRHHQIDLVGEPIIQGSGEQVKNDRTILFSFLDEIERRGICRHSYVIACGGGAFLDAVGFAAAIVHRGVRLIRIPTTAMGQADAGVGIKNGINAYGKKNFLGTFSIPWAVINDETHLKSLNSQKIRDGLVEAVKVAILKDRSFFETIEQSIPEILNPESQSFLNVIQRSAKLHVQHIAEGGDPFESGSTRPLDLGHWSAHKLETLSDHRLSHGEAVAVGLALDCLYAASIGMLHSTESQRICDLLQKLGFLLQVPELKMRDPMTGNRLVLKGLNDFREHLGGSLCITFPTQIGAYTQVNHVDTEAWEKGIDRLR